MNEQESVTAYTRFLAESVRNMSLHEASAILLGALCVAGEHDAMEPIRDIYVRINECDEQLELIASGQPKQQKLNLPDGGTQK